MSNTNSTNPEQGGSGSTFNALSLLQTAAAGSAKAPERMAQGNACAQAPQQSLEPTGQTQPTSQPGLQLNSNSIHDQMPQQQSQMSQQQLNEVARNQFMAISGDFAKAFQFAGLQPNNGGQMLSSGGNVNGNGANNFQQLLQQLASRPPPQQQPVVQSPAPTSIAVAQPMVGGNQQPPQVTSRRSVVVPCRARGMSMEHNFQTAYFVIPEDVKHGDGLICSFPACRNRGVKFLYCQYCKDPVARRNFRNRHNHAEERATEGSPEETKSSTKKTTDISKPAASAPLNESERGNGAGALAPAAVTSSSSQQASETSTSGSASSTVLRGPKKASMKRSLDEIAAWEQDEMIKAKLAKIGPERQSVWASLLAERPKSDDGDDMSAWLMRIMAVSDTKKPLDDEPLEDGEDSSRSNGTDRAAGYSGSSSSSPEEDTSSSENGDKASNSRTSGTSERMSPIASESSGSDGSEDEVNGERGAKI